MKAGAGRRRRSIAGKPAGELRVGDVWINRPYAAPSQEYRTLAIRPALTSTTIEVDVQHVATGRRRTLRLFCVNRVEVVT
jgi:hypothetical protein